MLSLPLHTGSKLDIVAICRRAHGEIVVRQTDPAGYKSPAMDSELRVHC